MKTPRITIRCERAIHRGTTLAELLVAIAILSVLLGIVVVAGRAVYNSQNRSSANQQIAAIAAAIDKYATYWPAWELTDNFGAKYKVADRGWPDYLPGRLFFTGFPNSPYLLDVSGRFNNQATGYEFFVADLNGSGFRSGIVESAGQPDRVIEGDVLDANMCLAYALTAKVGDGPYLNIDDDGALFKKAANEVATVASQYPQTNINAANNLHASNPAGDKLMLVDPWGTPYRYFWVYRDDTTYSGFAPVSNGVITNAAFRTAVGYVLESAGPDRKFGNRWINPANLADPVRENNEAADNLVVQRP